MGKLRKGILVIFIANIFNLGLSILRNIILPRYISVDTYAEIKLYQLYISYISFAAVGYIDGMYLKYGGQDVSRIDNVDLQKNISTFRWIELFFLLVIVTVGMVIKDRILVFAGITILAMNVTDYYKCLFQATGEFQQYSRIMNLSSALIFIANLFLIFVLKCDLSSYYILAYIAVYVFVWLLIEIKFSNSGHGRVELFTFSIDSAREAISTGFLLMCGLSLSNLMTGLDRWCVKFFMTTYDFALYAFAASIEGFLSFAISPISVTLYNYFCTHKNTDQNKKLKGQIHVFLALLISGAFIVKFILETYLSKYIAAYKVLFILFASQFIFGAIKCFYLNHFKTQKRQNQLFFITAIILAIGLGLNIILFLTTKVMEAFAVGTLLSAVIWYYICEYMFPEYKDGIRENLYSVTIIIAYLGCGFYFKSYIGLIIYIAAFLLLSVLFRRDGLIGILSICRDSIKKICNSGGNGK